MNGIPVSRIALTEHLELYVDGTNGNDANDGSQSRPFKTIQRAAYALPPVLGKHSAAINIASGSYPEQPGFWGTQGVLTLRNTTGTVEALSFIVNMSVILDFKSLILSGNSFSGITVSGNGHCQWLNGTGELTITDKDHALLCEENSVLHLHLASLTVSDCVYVAHAVRGGNANLNIGDFDGSGNEILYMSNGGLVQYQAANETVGAATRYGTIYGGRIYTGAQVNAPNY
jgi:hypothetical protein